MAGSDVTTSQALDRDVVCARCDYNLRGLQPDGRCPECGHSIADSMEAVWVGSEESWVHIRRLRHCAIGYALGQILAIAPFAFEPLQEMQLLLAGTGAMVMVTSIVMGAIDNPVKAGFPRGTWSPGIVLVATGVSLLGVVLLFAGQGSWELPVMMPIWGLLILVPCFLLELSRIAWILRKPTLATAGRIVYLSVYASVLFLLVRSEFLIVAAWMLPPAYALCWAHVIPRQPASE